MANTKSAAKRARQTKTRTARNRSINSALKTESKYLSVLLTKEPSPALAHKAYSKLVSELDRAAKRGVIHQNVADRRKSRLARKIAALA